MRMLIAAVLSWGVMSIACAAGVIEVDTTHQLFLDDAAVESMDNVTRTIHPVTKYTANPILKAEEDWEGTVALLYGSVIRDGNHFRMWYLSTLGASYAESADGLTWTKPPLGLFQAEGHETNVVALRPKGDVPASLPHFYELFGVFKDEDETDPAHRYKMGYLSLHKKYEGPREDPFHRTQRRGLGVAVSPDGIQWTSLNTWATEAICDGATHWMVDPKTGKYRIYGRTKFKNPDLLKAWGEDDYVRKYYWGRVVASTTSSDFEHWEHSDPATAPIVMEADDKDPIGTEIYGMSVFPYEGVYIGLVQRFHNRLEESFLDVQLAVSHDGVHFERVGDRTPFIPCGELGTWDRFNNSVANNPPIAIGDDLRFYYSGRSYRHSPYKGPDFGVVDSGIGVASIKRDRFVSLGASYDGGTILTKPIKLRGNKLFVNAMADYGVVRIEIVNGAGEVIGTAKPVQVDSLGVAVEWESMTTVPKDETVRLKFTLENALLYSFWTE